MWMALFRRIECRVGQLVLAAAVRPYLQRGAVTGAFRRQPASRDILLVLTAFGPTYLETALSNCRSLFLHIYA